MYRVISFDHEPQHVRSFIALPYRLYRKDPRWIPPFKKDVEDSLGDRHLFRSFLKQRNFLVLRGEEVVGRASAFINERVTLESGLLGSLGNFECENDPEAASRLCEAAFDWLKNQGVKTVWGPMNGSFWLAYRFMTKGFEDMPLQGEPYNPPYYPALFEKVGFTPLKRWKTTFQSHAELEQGAKEEKTLRRYEKALESGYRFRNFEMARFDEELRLLYRLFSETFSQSLGFHPIEEESFLSIYRGLKNVCIPEMIFFALDPQDQVVGFTCCLPDLPNIRAMRGEDNLWAKLKFLATRRKPTHYIHNPTGVFAKERGRHNIGIGGGLIHLVGTAVLERGGTHVGFMMAEDAPTLAFSKGLYSRYHEYFLYQKSL